MTRFAKNQQNKTNRQGAAKAVPASDTAAGYKQNLYKTAPYRMGGYRQPVYQPHTRFTITPQGRAALDASNKEGGR